MINEYAVDPALLNSWEMVRYYLDKFGVDQGRLIALFPRQWIGEILKHLPGGEEAAAQMLRKRVTERIAHAAHCFAPRAMTNWQAAQPWLVNAEREHAVTAFQGIVAGANPNGRDYVIVGDELNEATPHPRWQVQRVRDVTRDGRSMAAAVRPLLRNARTLLLIDRNFDPKIRRFQEPLVAILDELRRFNTAWSQTQIVYHSGDKFHAPSDFRDLCKGNLEKQIPAGMRVRFVRWRFREFHPRDLVTDRGGVNFEQGLDAAGVGEPIQTVRLTLLDRAYSDGLRLAYMGSPPRYTPDPGGEVEVVGTRSG